MPPCRQGSRASRTSGTGHLTATALEALEAGVEASGVEEARTVLAIEEENKTARIILSDPETLLLSLSRDENRARLLESAMRHAESCRGTPRLPLFQLFQDEASAYWL